MYVNLLTSEGLPILTNNDLSLLVSGDWLPPIYDRTLYDVNRAIELNNKYLNGTITNEEKIEWKNGLKGALNKSDLDRILVDINYLSNKSQVSITSQTIPEIPTISWYSELLTNIQTLVNAIGKRSETPDLPTQPLNTYTKWNIIEKHLQDMYEITSSYVFNYCGNNELYSNDNALI